MRARAEAASLDVALLAREAGLERASRRWSRTAHAAALGFVAMLYASPMYWWPELERLRLGFVTMALCAAAVVAHRLSSGERIRLGGGGSLLLLAYLAFIPLSLTWTLSRPDTLHAVVDGAKMAVVFVAIQNALDAPSRLGRFLRVAALASLGPALGGVWVWANDDHLVEGFRTHWRGLYGDPNRLAMSLVAVLPFALLGAMRARRPAARVLFAGVVAAQVAAIVLTHSRSGAVAAALAALLFLLRGRGARLRGPLAAAALLAGVVALAPQSFWERSRTIADYRDDASVAGREHAWKVLGNIVDERPLSGVGAGAFLASWARYAPLEAGGRRYVAHNLLLEIVGDLGILAFALFAAFVAWLLWQTWRAGDDPLVGPEARAVFAGLAGYLVCEMANGYSLSWFLYFLFACAVAAVRLARVRAAAGERAAPAPAPGW
ncbi:O-antigen polymerase [Anaeromyxobacter sp. K]|uniref:O-antigen ligase family protein n=1 Tax=Anaeromyxobacter sp. (strain K) TaxID=447217 RepID=UPI00017BE34F|nr:O-antigen ligase family protein [Anaeromyxobacter sp. K]ACG73951.1 O-antigen polymerase [Anaeromyxobacter sp. K]